MPRMRPVELAKSLGIQLWTPVYLKGKGVAMKQTDDGAYIHLGDLPQLAKQSAPTPPALDAEGERQLRKIADDLELQNFDDHAGSLRRHFDLESRRDEDLSGAANTEQQAGRGTPGAIPDVARGTADRGPEASAAPAPPLAASPGLDAEDREQLEGSIRDLRALCDRLHDASDTERACATGAQFARQIADDFETTVRRLASHQPESGEGSGVEAAVDAFLAAGIRWGTYSERTAITLGLQAARPVLLAEVLRPEIDRLREIERDCGEVAGELDPEDEEDRPLRPELARIQSQEAGQTAERLEALTGPLTQPAVSAPDSQQEGRGELEAAARILDEAASRCKVRGDVDEFRFRRLSSDVHKAALDLQGEEGRA